MGEVEEGEKKKKKDIFVGSPNLDAILQFAFMGIDLR
jgi:hypothetical protein